MKLPGSNIPTNYEFPREVKQSFFFRRGHIVFTTKTPNYGNKWTTRASEDDTNLLFVDVS